MRMIITRNIIARDIISRNQDKCVDRRIGKYNIQYKVSTKVSSFTKSLILKSRKKDILKIYSIFEEQYVI